MKNPKETICYNCKKQDIQTIHKGVRDNSSIDVLQCKNCGLVFLSNTAHINNEFYADGGMVKNINFENWRQNTYPDDERRFLSLKKSLTNKTLVDFGCGNANFLNLAKNECKKVYGIELQKDFCEYFKKCNLTVFESIDNLPENADVITMFHVLEHLKDPTETLKNIKEKLNDNGQIIIEVPNSNDVLLKLYKSKSFADFVYWSCHLFVFNTETLKQTVEKAGYKIQKIHHIQRYTMMNHLYWLLKNKPGGHKIWAKYDSKILNLVYSITLKLLKMTDTIEIVAQKV